MRLLPTWICSVIRFFFCLGISLSLSLPFLLFFVAWLLCLSISERHQVWFHYVKNRLPAFTILFFCTFLRYC
jgi:hypothetical protein